ncbi:MAG: lysine--tRNA ligase, partial [bacterium]
MSEEQSVAHASAHDGAEEDDLPEQMRVRREKRDRLLASGHDPYAVRLPLTHTIGEVRASYPDLDADAAPGDRVAIAGRVIFQRT